MLSSSGGWQLKELNGAGAESIWDPLRRSVMLHRKKTRRAIASYFH